MNTLEQNRYTEAWAALGATLPRQPRPRHSANWYTNATAVTAMAAPRTIHDFFGFPDRLFAYEYPCPGAPEVAAEVAEVAEPRWVGLDHDSWGIDHGTWSVLADMYPRRRRPRRAARHQRPPTARLPRRPRGAPAPPRSRGVLIVASGNVVHNLGVLDWSARMRASTGRRRFDEAARRVVVDSPGDVLSLPGHPDYHLAVPTPDHFIPLLYFAGVAGADSARRPEVLIDGYAYGSLSMTCYSA